MTEWFERWFGEDYLRLYPHRNDEDAARAISLVATVVPIRGARILDLACGPGRHAVHLQARGATVVGLDLSMTLLQRARQGSPPVQRLVRADMRRLPFRSRFDAVVNLFTSFGYFAQDAQHQAVVHGLAAIVRPAGHLVIDYLNADQVRAALVPSERRDVDGHPVAITRRLVDGGRFVEKEMQLVGEDQRFIERVRLFGPDDLTRLLEVAGFAVTHRYGDYLGGRWSPESPRAFLVAVRK